MYRQTKFACSQNDSYIHVIFNAYLIIHCPMFTGKTNLTFLVLYYAGRWNNWVLEYKIFFSSHLRQKLKYF